jgi:hypothetical protein
LMSAPELSKHLTTSQCPSIDAINNGGCPDTSLKLTFWLRCHGEHTFTITWMLQ